MDPELEEELLRELYNAIALELASSANRVALNLENFISIQSQRLTGSEVLRIIYGGQSLIPATEIASMTTAINEILAGAINRAWGTGMGAKLAETPEALYYWRLSPGNNCPDCIDRAGFDPQPFADWEMIGLPRDGVTLCQANCNCVLDTDSGQIGAVQDEGI